MIIIPVRIQNTLENDPKLFIIVTGGKLLVGVCVKVLRLIYMSMECLESTM